MVAADCSGQKGECVTGVMGDGGRGDGVHGQGCLCVCGGGNDRCSSAVWTLGQHWAEPCLVPGVQPYGDTALVEDIRDCFVCSSK